MEKTNIKYKTYVGLLNQELIPAMGCTEPIALAYGAAIARDHLGSLPDTVEIKASSSFIKNVKSVIVPNTDQLKGMPAAAAAGIIAGVAAKKLEAISVVSDEQKAQIRDFLKCTRFVVEKHDAGHPFEIIITIRKGENYVLVHLLDYHTNIVSVIKNDVVLYNKEEYPSEQGEENWDRTLLDIDDIFDFANTVDLSDVHDIIKRQIICNSAIAEEGLKTNYGANIGKVLLKTYGNDILTRAKAKAAAGSDARMSGCELPVVINSGSGNQGITCSVPVIEYAKELNSSEEMLYRALVLSNLIAIHLKTGIGTLSAYCGAVSAGAAAGAGIAYLIDGELDMIKHVVVDALAIVSGILCDGAKPSCAAKIAMSIEAAILSIRMYRMDQQFHNGDGIVMKDIEETIKSVGIIGREGMKSTNDLIVHLMLKE